MKWTIEAVMADLWARAERDRKKYQMSNTNDTHVEVTVVPGEERVEKFRAINASDIPLTAKNIVAVGEYERDYSPKHHSFGPVCVRNRTGFEYEIKTTSPDRIRLEMDRETAERLLSHMYYELGSGTPLCSRLMRPLYKAVMGVEYKVMGPSPRDFHP